jgi:hypothetical protein
MAPGQKLFGKEAFRKTAEEMKGGEASGIRFEDESDIEEISFLIVERIPVRAREL